MATTCSTTAGHALDVRAQQLASAGRTQRALRPVDECRPHLPLERRQLLRDRGLRVAQHRRGGGDRAEVQHQPERAEALHVAQGHEANLLRI